MRHNNSNPDTNPFTLQYIRARLEEISGPWAEYSTPEGDYIGSIKLAPLSQQVRQGVDGDPDWAELAQYRKNINFLANSPEYVKYLLMKVDKLEEPVRGEGYFPGAREDK